jgi:GNAT superfamily N-acetyltransferase
MKIVVTMELLDKTVEIDGVMRDVYGVAALHCHPQWQGLGRAMLHWAEEKAKRDGKFCCLGFALPHTYEKFDKKAGWSDCGMYEGRVVTASIPAAKVVVHERW